MLPFLKGIVNKTLQQMPTLFFITPSVSAFVLVSDKPVSITRLALQLYIAFMGR
jgi:hypothetical protein